MSEIAGFFIGIGAMSLLGVCSYLVYQMARVIKIDNDYYEKVKVLEECIVKKVAERKKINLDLEIAKKSYISKMPKNKYSFQKELKKQVYEEMFGKVKEEK